MNAAGLREIGGFAVEGVLGCGRHAMVYLARPARTGAALALKVASSAQAGRGLRREFEWMAALRTSRAIAAIGHGTSGSRTWLAMEHAPGGSLAARGKPFPVHEVLAVLSDVGLALAELHARGCVHRDVKPANLLLRADGSVALADFGSACAVGTAGGGSLAGSPAYAAPEQLHGGAAAPAADIYSVGVCVFELLTGRLPFRGETLAETASQHVAAPVPRLATELAAWQPLLEALLAKRPAERPADGAALLDLLSSVRGCVAAPAPSHRRRN